MATKYANLLFYQGKIPAEPGGIYIDDIHSQWGRDMHRLEFDHNYIQWLFPTRESGQNSHAQALRGAEAAAIRNDRSVMEKFRRSYEMMLHFYGMRLLDRDSGEVTRGGNWQEQFKNLNFSEHNFLRITRILKSLGELGLEHYKAPLLRFLVTEAVQHRTLQNTLDSCNNYWIPTLKDPAEREKLKEHIRRSVHERQRTKERERPSSASHSRLTPAPAWKSGVPAHTRSILYQTDDSMGAAHKSSLVDRTTRYPGLEKQEHPRLQRLDQLLKDLQQQPQHGQHWIQRQNEYFPPQRQLQPYHHRQSQEYPHYPPHQSLQDQLQHEQHLHLHRQGERPLQHQYHPSSYQASLQRSTDYRNTPYWFAGGN